MNGIDKLLRVARAFGEALDLDPKTVSWRVFGDSKKLAALESGKDIQVTRFEGALQWFSDNWPSDTAWPDGVQRPTRSEAAA